MVDFQSRDTRRDTNDEGEAADDDTENEPDSQAAEPPVDADDGHAEAPHSDEHDHNAHSNDRQDDHGHNAHSNDRQDDHEHDGAAHDHEHSHHAHDIDHLGVAVVTVSTSRSIDEDTAGDRAIEAIEAAGHDIPTRELIADDYDGVQSAVNALVRRDDVDVVVTSGGTGVTPDDVTIEAVKPLFEKTLPGFGELFRRRSEDEIGTRVVGTRAAAGIADGVPVFCLPGSENAVRLGVDEIVLEEAPHLAGLARREA